MRLIGLTAAFLFWCIFISPLYSQPGWEDEEPPAPQLDEGLFFFEELFVLEESLLGEEAPTGDETILSEDTLPDETIPDETISDDEPLISTPPPPPPSEEDALSEETLPGDEPLLSEETIPDELDDTGFFFEAPPLIFEVPEFEIRSFDAIFPNFSRIQRSMAMSGRGGLRRSFTKDESAMFIPAPDLGIDLLGSVMEKNPSHLIEALALVPYRGKEFDLLDIYNALGRIEEIKNYPALMNGNDLYVFTESTRIESARNRKALPDPSPAVTLPFSETMYLRLKEINFGNLFIRADISISMYGITYSMTNFTDVRYFLIPMMKAERFNTIIYLEPVKEGVLIYSITGFFLPGFIADRVNLTPNINRRIEIFTNWITDGLREQESAAAE